jgi:NAD(P)-dependent dehydrogenase (short-subunit alcohol dehydrogenase family)
VPETAGLTARRPSTRTPDQPDRSKPVPRYTDRRVLVTGGGSGIGQACVLRILAEGGRVIAADISEAGLADTAAKAGASGSMLSTVVMDVGSEDSVIAGVRTAIATLGGLDTLVNVAGILRSAHFAETTLADFEQVLRVNLVGTFLVTREALAALRQEGFQVPDDVLLAQLQPQPIVQPPAPEAFVAQPQPPVPMEEAGGVEGHVLKRKAEDEAVMA